MFGTQSIIDGSSLLSKIQNTFAQPEVPQLQMKPFGVSAPNQDPSGGIMALIAKLFGGGGSGGQSAASILPHALSMFGGA